MDTQRSWTLLVYKIPSQPSRLRLQVWRKLQSMGAVYLQDAVCVLPSRDDLDENLQYVAMSIAEMGGIYHLFQARSLLPGGDERLVEDFRRLADQGMDAILERLSDVEQTADPSEAERAEGELKRQRIAYLRARRLAYFGSSRQELVDQKLEAFRRELDGHFRSDFHQGEDSSSD